MHETQVPGRNLLHAWLRGWAVLLLAVAATIEIVCVVIWGCGGEATLLLFGLLPLPFAGALAFYAWLARDA